MDDIPAKTFQHVSYTDEQKALFFHTLNNAAKQFGCQYISYVYERPESGVRMGFSTNPDWQEQYISDGLIEDCHLWNSVLRYFVNTSRPAYILPWETVIPDSEAQEKIMTRRDEFGIGRNGISFCTQNANKREFLAFAPAGNEQNFTKNLVSNMESVRKFAGVFQRATREALKKIGGESKE